MTSPFAIFDLPVAFNVDQALLSERYLALQKSLHPDNFVMLVLVGTDIVLCSVDSQELARCSHSVLIIDIFPFSIKDPGKTVNRP